MSNKLKLGLVLILESVLKCHHKKTSIGIFHSKVVGDIDMLKNYPWGKDVVWILFTSFGGDIRCLWGRPKAKYNTYGVSLAL